MAWEATKRSRGQTYNAGLGVVGFWAGFAALVLSLMQGSWLAGRAVRASHRLRWQERVMSDFALGVVTGCLVSFTAWLGLAVGKTILRAGSGKRGTLREITTALTQYGDLQGTIAVDGHEASSLRQLAKESEMPTGYRPVGLSLYAGAPPIGGSLQAYLLAVEEEVMR